MSVLALCVGLLAAALSVPAAVRPDDLPPLRGDQAPAFSADPVMSLDPDGRPALGVTISIPFQELQWIRLPGPGDQIRFASRAEFTVVFEPARGGPLAGDVWERRLVVPSYAATRSPRADLVDHRSFALSPGRYDLRVTVRDLNAETQSVARQRIDVPDYAKVPVGFSDLELGVVDSAAAFRPVPTRVFGLEVQRLAARVALFDRRTGTWPRRYVFRYRIRDDVGQELVEGSTNADVARSSQPVIVRPSQTDLFLGGYVFEVELVDGKSRWRVERSFEVDESGPPRGREFERMLEPLSFIAEASEIERLRSVPVDQQTAAWEEFWRRRDPTPDTPHNEALVEFIRRVRYTERHFQGFGPGWRSDMGRIYIKFGPPDQVESRPGGPQSYPLEIWYYHDPYRRFIFEDREGFGRFALRLPAME